MYTICYCVLVMTCGNTIHGSLHKSLKLSLWPKIWQHGKRSIYALKQMACNCKCYHWMGYMYRSAHTFCMTTLVHLPSHCEMKVCKAEQCLWMKVAVLNCRTAWHCYLKHSVIVTCHIRQLLGGYRHPQVEGCEMPTCNHSGCPVPVHRDMSVAITNSA
jgi:hypothetical protein